MKKALLIGVPFLLVLGAGTTVGLGMLGIINVPFLPLGKKKIKVPPDDGKGGPFAAYARSIDSAGRIAQKEIDRLKSIVPPAPPKPPVDTAPGEAKLASLWAEMPTDRLVAVVEKWPDPQLGRILSKMDDEVATKLLAALPAARAMALSRAVANATDERAAKVHEN